MPVAEIVKKQDEAPTLENTFVKAKDIKKIKKLKIAIWSKPGLGKSYFAMS